MKSIRYALLILAIFASHTLLESCSGGTCSVKGRAQTTSSAKPAKPKKVSSNDKRVKDTIAAYEEAKKEAFKLNYDLSINFNEQYYRNTILAFNEAILNTITNLLKLKNLDQLTYNKYVQDFNNNFPPTIFYRIGFDQNPNIAIGQMMTYYSNARHFYNKIQEVANLKKQVQAANNKNKEKMEKKLQQEQKSLKNIQEQFGTTMIGNKTMQEITDERIAWFKETAATMQAYQPAT